jgi:hypothetical protein
MRLAHDIHLAYCTNIHRGESWPETLHALESHTLRVKAQVCPDQPYAIGLRLSQLAASQLAHPPTLAHFRSWLDKHDCYVFTINGFPYGAFHGTRVKEQVYAPDWTSPDRLAYTCLLFDLLAQLLPQGMPGSVSTLPASFKPFQIGEQGVLACLDHLADCARYIQELSVSSGHDLHLGLEPEPLGLFETSGETLKFFGLLYDRHHVSHDFLLQRIGVNYDTCHLAIEFEEAGQALGRLASAGLRISKLHLSSALRLEPTPDALEKLAAFQEDTYLHQVVVRSGEDPLLRFPDLPHALDFANTNPHQLGDEWRVHFHIPLHSPPGPPFSDTRDHLDAALDWLAADPSRCQHLEMETYTWEILPPNIHSADVVDQLVAEYHHTLQALSTRNLTQSKD